MSKWLSLSGLLVGATGIFFGFFYLGSDPRLSLQIVTISTVGIVGVLAFVRHFIFHKADAKRMGWETNRPEWAYEVGFANMAFGVMGLLAVFANLGVMAEALTVFGYAVYLAQAAMLNGYEYAKSDPKSPEKLWRIVIGTTSFSAMMLFFSLYAIFGWGAA